MGSDAYLLADLNINQLPAVARLDPENHSGDRRRQACDKLEAALTRQLRNPPPEEVVYGDLIDASPRRAGILTRTALRDYRYVPLRRPTSLRHRCLHSERERYRLGIYIHDPVEIRPASDPSRR